MFIQIDAAYYALAAGSAAIGGVVGFGLQVTSLRKAQLEIDELGRKQARAELENEKLRLELDDLLSKIQLSKLTKEKTELEVVKLRRDGEKSSPLVTEMTTDEVIKYADIRFSRTSSESITGDQALREIHEQKVTTTFLTLRYLIGALLIGFILYTVISSVDSFIELIARLINRK
jgi:hypothetical protein